MNNNLFQSLPIVAHAIGQHCGVCVKVGGEIAYTDGQTVHLPYPKAFDRDVLLGFLVHEASHVRFSDFRTLKRIKTPIVKHLQNIYEDARIERLICGVYRGANGFLKRTVKHVFGDAYQVSENATSLTILMDFIAFDVWDRFRLSGGILTPHARTTRQLAQRLFPHEFLDELCAINDKVALAKSSDDTLVLANEVHEKLKAFFKDHPQTMQSQSESPSTKSDAFNEGKDNDKQGNPSLSKTDVKDDANGSQALNASRSSLPSQSQPNGSTTARKTSAEKTKPLRAQVLKALDAYEDASKDLAKTLAGDIAQQVKDSGVHEEPLSHSATNVPATRQEDVLASDFLNESRALSQGLKRQLSGLVEAAARRQTKTRQSGRKIAKTKLARLAYWNTRVFEKTLEHTSTASAVHILLDMSGSMRGREVVAAKAATALLMALMSLPKTNPALSIFPATTVKAASEVIVAHGEKLTHGVNGRFHRFFASGGTPLARALAEVVQALALTREKRRIVIVITDGAPDDEGAAKAYLEKMKLSGIDIYGIGIGYDVSHLFDNSVTIKSVQELTKVLFALAKHTSLLAVH